MNWFDILLGIVVAASIIAGLAKGLARSLIGLASVVVAFLCALWFYGAAGSFLADPVGSRNAANVVGFCLVFLAIALFGSLVAALMARVLKWAHLSWLDRLLGGGFGFLRGALVAAGLVVAIMAFGRKEPPRAVVESRMAPYVLCVADVIVTAAPYEIKEGFRRSHNQVKKLWEDMLKRRLREPEGDKL